MDPELRDAFERLAADLRGEIRSGDAETRDSLERLAVDLRGEIRSVDAKTRTYVDASAAETRAYIEASAIETRRHSHVIAESVRGDIRSLAELMGISNERTDQRIGQQAGQTDGLEGRVLKLEARVSVLEDNRTPGRPRRRRQGGR